MPTILIPHQTGSNIYVRELGRGYHNLGCKVIYGTENLLEQNIIPDLLHLQWPEEQYRWKGDGNLHQRVSKFISSLITLKESGVKIAWTVHNINPHDHSSSQIDDEAYQRVIDLTDLIVHHCPESSILLRRKYRVPNEKLEVTSPHGHYLAYPNKISREDARLKLHIPKDAFVYLHFGNVRGYKGLNLLFDAFKKLSAKNKYLLVAGRYDVLTGRGALRDRLLLAWKRRFSNISLILYEIPSDDIDIYIKASDCLVLSHTTGLNSGVAVLGMTFGKMVIGPNIGCMQWVLSEGNNLLYDAGDSSSLRSAMTTALESNTISCERINKDISQKWRWEEMALKIITTLNIRH